VIQAIKWDVTPEIIEGWSTPNLYGLLFVSGLMLGYFVVRRMFKKEGISDAILDKLVLYMVIATIVGARLGHVLFYGPYWDVLDHEGRVLQPGYFSNPVEIIKIWEGGLASHGGILAIFIALLFFSKRVAKRHPYWILDKISAPGILGGMFIRLGNLVNSEIVGNVTDVPWGFKFMHHDCFLPNCSWEMIPTRHPSQLYEAIAYLLIFILLMYMYYKRNAWKKPGVIFGTFMIVLFVTRFLVEFTKIPQVDERGDWLFNTGQLLSIPFILGGAYVLYTSLKKKPEEPSATAV
jgi:prolipoprotein diacylglyceryl transferase